MPKVKKNRRRLYDQRKNMHRCKSYSLDPVDANEGNPVDVNEGDMVHVSEGDPVDVSESNLVHVNEGDPVDVSEGGPVDVYEGDTVDVNECDITGDSNVSEHVDVSTMTDELNHCALFLLQLLPKRI